MFTREGVGDMQKHPLPRFGDGDDGGHASRTVVKWGLLQDNRARDVDLPALVNVRPKWALTIAQATTLLAELAPLARTMVGLALSSGLRRGELFALRWRDFDEPSRCVTVRAAVPEGTFSTPKTAAGMRQIPLSEPATWCRTQAAAMCGAVVRKK